MLIEFIVDADVPPLPPHITFDQARSYMTAVLKDDPDNVGIVKRSVKQMASGVLPERKGDR